jgi:hypothetical protein
VQKFLAAVMNAPKRLWHPVLFIVDEAHKFMPEKGEGESEAKPEMLSLASDGRKYGFCAIFATQRLAKLDKSGASELTNVLVGPTFMDIDLERAHKALGIVNADKRAFNEQMRTMSPGHFWALGRAISKTRILVKIGAIETTHPTAGSGKYSAEPPPAPEKVKLLLPKLADLPKEAEEKARTEAEFRREIRELQGKLKAAERATPAATKSVAVVDQKAIERAVKSATAPLLRQIETMQKRAKDAIYNFTRAAAPLNEIANLPAPEIPKAFVTNEVVSVHTVQRPLPSQREPRATAAAVNGDLTRPEQNILDQLAELEALGISQPEKAQLSLMAGYTNARSGGFSEPLGRLLQYGYASYPKPGIVQLTDDGRAHARPVDRPMTTADLHERLCQKLGGPEAKLLREIIAIYPEQISKEDLGAKLGYTNVRSGGFSEPVGRLRSLGIIQYPERNAVKAADWLFLEAA